MHDGSPPVRQHVAEVVDELSHVFALDRAAEPDCLENVER